MELKIIGSNSAGNCYLLQSASDTLMIDCGVPVLKIKQALNYNVDQVNCIVTHSHGDHAKSIQDVLNFGVNVYASKETFKAKNVASHHRAKWILPAKNYNIGSFQVKPFTVHHDVPCYGFIIQHEECGLTLFLTDTYYCDYKFPGLNNIIIEANHDTDIIKNNGTPRFLNHRIIQSHMNIKTCKELLKANDLSAVNNIVLIHLSNSNSDERQFLNEVKELTGKNVSIAQAGMTIDNFNKCAI